VLDEYTCAVRRSSPVHNGDAVIDKPGPMHVQVVGETKREERERERGKEEERKKNRRKRERERERDTDVDCNQLHESFSHVALTRRNKGK